MGFTDEDNQIISKIIVILKKRQMWNINSSESVPEVNAFLSLLKRIQLKSFRNAEKKTLKRIAMVEGKCRQLTLLPTIG